MTVHGQPVPPGVRRVDPDAEVARLAEARQAASRNWLVLPGEVVDVPGGESFRVNVLTTKPVAFPPDLLARLTEMVRECWPADD